MKMTLVCWQRNWKFLNFQKIKIYVIVCIQVSIVESICIPSECDNDSDRSILFQLPVGNSPQNLLNPKIYYYPTHLNVNEGIE